MPNDYITHSEYPFDLDYAHQYIRSLAPDLSFLKNCDEFLEQWFKKISVCNLHNVQRISQGDLSGQTQLFQKSITLFDQPAMLHFNANMIRGLAINHTVPIHLDISSVVNKMCHIAYTPCSHIDGFEKNDDPILLIQFPLGECELLVIDGNHRLSSRIYKKVRRIDAYIADYSMSLIGLSDLFEQSLYAFICDIRYVQVNKALLIGQCYNSVFLSCLAK